MLGKINKAIMTMRYAACRISMVALAASVLVFITGCMTTGGARTEQYHLRESGIQTLSTAPSDCGTGDSAVQAVADAEKVRFTLISEQNVDAAYARIKQAFGFHPPNERTPTAGIPDAPPRPGAAYHYRIAPGVGYSMRERRQINRHTGVIQINIEHNDGNDGGSNGNSSGSRLTVLYNAGGKDGFPRGEGFRRLVEAKVREALR